MTENIVTIGNTENVYTFIDDKEENIEIKVKFTQWVSNTVKKVEVILVNELPNYLINSVSYNSNTKEFMIQIIEGTPGLTEFSLEMPFTGAAIQGKLNLEGDPPIFKDGYIFRLA